MSERKRSQTTEQAQDTKPAAKKDQRVEQETKGPLMYVGPTVTGLAIQNRVYSEIPKEAEEAFTTNPELRNLFLPVREYPKANRMLRSGTGYIYSAFQVALGLRR